MDRIEYGDFRRFIFLLKRYVRPYWKTIVALVFISYIVAFLTILFPAIMAPILDIAMRKEVILKQAIHLRDINLTNLGSVMLSGLGVTVLDNRLRIIFIFCILYVVVALIKNILDFAVYYLALRVRVRAARDISYDLFRHILNFSMDFFSQERTGALVSRLDKDAQASVGDLEETVRILITAPILILFYGILLFKTSYKLVIAAFFAAALHYFITRCIQRPIRQRVVAQFSTLANAANKLYESILSIRVVKTFCAEKFELKQFKNILKDVVNVNMRYGIYEHVEEPARSTLNYFIEASILLIAASELLSGKLSISTFILFLYVGRIIMKPISDLGKVLTSVQYALAASSRIFDLFGMQTTIKDGSYIINDFKDKIEINNVSFAYHNEKLVLEDINLEIKKNQTVALVGPSGAGKSTLVDLILRFYDTQKGFIAIDGVNLKSLKIESYRSLFGVVPQEALLFNATVRDNIAYGRNNIKEADIIRAAEVANAHEFIMQLPEGYNTTVGDRGVRLSGGQRQRIAIARAIVTSPSILILDEATSSLDTESERLVQEAIDRVIMDTTAIVIAHRLSTVLNADKIVVMENGRIINIGTHKELLEKSLLYNKLYTLQFSEPSLLFKEEGGVIL